MMTPPQQAPPDLGECGLLEVLDCIEVVVIGIADEWMRAGMNVMIWVFGSLALLEVVVTGYTWWMRRGSAGDLASQLALKMSILAFIILLFTSMSWWLPETMLFFPRMIGRIALDSSAAGISSDVMPTALLRIGLGFAAGAFTSGGLTVFTMFDPIHSLATLLIILVSLAMMGVYIRLAAELIGTLVESYIAVGGGLILAGTLAFRGTAPIGEGWLQYVVYVAIKLFFLYLLCAFAITIGDQLLQLFEDRPAMWVGILNFFFGTNEERMATGGFAIAAAMATVVFLFAGLTRLPDRIASTISQNVSFGVKDVLRRL